MMAEIPTRSASLSLEGNVDPFEAQLSDTGRRCLEARKTLDHMIALGISPPDPDFVDLWNLMMRCHAQLSPQEQIDCWDCWMNS
jgi:hypothetical protein